MKYIPLTQGKFTIVDDEDYGWLSRYKWCALKSKHTWYACRYIAVKGKTKSVLMHREILKVPKNLLTDHKNHKGYDNQKCNLRVCTYFQNQQNRAKNIRSKYKGMYWDNSHHKWRGQIRCNGKKYFLGYFTDEIKAARAYDDKARELFGEFAATNF